MLTIVETFEFVTHESSEAGGAHDQGIVAEHRVGFRELVRMIKDGAFTEPSSRPATATRWEWLTSYASEPAYGPDRGSGWENRSLHLAASNPGRADRYWKLAWRAAGVRGV